MQNFALLNSAERWKRMMKVWSGPFILSKSGHHIKLLDINKMLAFGAINDSKS